MDELKSKLSQRASIIIWGIVTLLFSVSLLFLAQLYNELKSAQFIGQGIEFQNTISVSGKGEVTIIPDVAEFSFAVIKEAETVEEAQQNVTEIMNDILSFLESFDVEGKDVKTTRYNIVPRYEYRSISVPRGGQGGGDVAVSYPEIYPPYPPNRERVLVGYEVSHWVSIKVKETKNTGKIVSELGTRGATNISGVDFTIDDEDEVLREARQKAIDDAKEKARDLARDLGVRLVRVVSFSEYGGPVYYARLESAKAFGMGADVMPEPPEIPVGENTVTSQVTITYAIE